MTTTATHLIATHDDHQGEAYAIPLNWESIAAPEWPEGDLTAFEFGDFHPQHAVRIEWDEDETRETFEAAVNAAGFRIISYSIDGYLAVKA